MAATDRLNLSSAWRQASAQLQAARCRPAWHPARARMSALPPHPHGVAPEGNLWMLGKTAAAAARASRRAGEQPSRHSAAPPPPQRRAAIGQGRGRQQIDPGRVAGDAAAAAVNQPASGFTRVHSLETSAHLCLTQSALWRRGGKDLHDGGRPTDRCGPPLLCDPSCSLLALHRKGLSSPCMRRAHLLS